VNNSNWADGDHIWPYMSGPPTDNARFTLVDRVLVNKDLRNFGVIGWVYYKGDDSQGLVSIYGTLLKVMIGGREEGWGGDSLI